MSAEGAAGLLESLGGTETELPSPTGVRFSSLSESNLGRRRTSRKGVGNESPEPPAGYERSGLLELSIRLRDRVDRQPELLSERSHGWQPLAGPEGSALDERGQPETELLGLRDTGTAVDAHAHASIMTRPRRVGRVPRPSIGCEPMSVKIGVGLFTGQIPPGSSRTFATEYRETLELVRLAESLGFDSAWVSEHHGSSDGYLPSLLLMLAAFAAVTERIELGTGLILTPFHDPLRLAEDAAVADQISNGRLILGLGLGWREEEFRMFGVPRPERATRTAETIEVLRRAWTGDRFSFQGKAFRYDRVKVTPPSARAGGIPIYLGGYKERAVRRAGELADGYIRDAGPPEDVRSALEHLDEGARAAGRDPRTLALTLMQNAFVSRGADAFETVRPGVAHQVGTYDAWDEGHDTPEHDALEPPPPTDDELRTSTIAGRPEEVVVAVRKLLASVADRPVHLIVRLHYPGLDVATATSALELFGREVLPALRSG